MIRRDRDGMACAPSDSASVRFRCSPRSISSLASRAAFARNVGPSVRQLTALMRPSAANEIMASSMSAFMPKSSPHTITCLIKNSPRTSISARPACAPCSNNWFFVAVGCAAAATHWAVAVGCVELAAALCRRQPGRLAGRIRGVLHGHYRLTFRHSRIPWTIAIRRFFLVSAAGFLVNEAPMPGCCTPRRSAMTCCSP